ncbi:MAG TPA: hypothetical protein VME47_12065 [Acetobacteraceae bacterium]|nr:hypothetical protein [Acetobacteraceae bacterium]
MNFRIYLLDATCRIRAAESFSATNETEAAEMAAATYDACSDVFEGYEVWCGSARLLRGRRTEPGEITLNAWDVVMMRQENILDLEDRLSRSFACVRESCRLLAVSGQLRELSRFEGDTKH